MKCFSGDESGLSLVEVLATIVIVTIILISFFRLFTQTAATTRVSYDLIDTTYFAQQEMEYIYRLTTDPLKANRLESIVQQLNTIGFVQSTSHPFTFIKLGEDGLYSFTLHVKDDLYDEGYLSQLVRFTLFVCESENVCDQTKAKAQM